MRDSPVDNQEHSINKDATFASYERDLALTRLQDVPAAPVMRTLIGALTMIADGRRYKNKNRIRHALISAHKFSGCFLLGEAASATHEMLRHP